MIDISDLLLQLQTPSCTEMVSMVLYNFVTSGYGAFLGIQVVYLMKNNVFVPVTV